MEKLKNNELEVLKEKYASYIKNVDLFTPDIETLKN